MANTTKLYKTLTPVSDHVRRSPNIELANKSILLSLFHTVKYAISDDLKCGQVCIQVWIVSSALSWFYHIIYTNDRLSES